MRIQDVGVVPFFAGVTGVVMLFGTVIGQSGNTDSADSNSMNAMSGMDMGPGSSMSSMPGMSMSSNSPAAPAPAAPGTTMQMPDGSTMAAAAMPAAPPAPHTTCSGSTCTVQFTKDATGTADVLGTTAKLDQASTKDLVLTVGGRKVTLRPGKSVRSGKVELELTKVSDNTWTVKFSKAH